MSHSLSSFSALGRKRARASGVFSGGCMLGSEGWLARFLAFVIAAVVPISQSVYSLWPQQM